MKLYRVHIELLSAISTPLKGDTLWGHVVWGIANHEGDGAVASFLEACKAGEPPLVISSAFPKGMLPKPVMNDHVEYALLTKSQYAAIKETKKRTYIPSFLETGDNDGAGHGYFVRQTQLHNTISRLDLTVSDGGLYATESLWPQSKAFYKERPIFDVYVVSNVTSDRIVEYLSWAFENGYGADASIGKGVVVVHPDIEEVPVPSLLGKRCMALGPFIADIDHPLQDLLADVFIRRGKIGGAFASSVDPYKKTVVLYNEGATFINTTDGCVVGNVLVHMHTDERICQSGFCPIIPLPMGGAV